jgi:prophage DNA circulation protein
MIPWQSRLRANITLIAPNGGQFTASWEGDDITVEKMVGQFNTPLRDGTTTQDVGSKGWAFPLSLSFEGDNNDTDAFNFAKALAQRGPWSVIHPVYGQFLLQPVGPFTIGAKPTASGNISTVSGSWIEVLPDDTTKSIAELGAQASAQIDSASAAAAAQFQSALSLESEAMGAATSAGNRSLGALLSSGLQGIINLSADLQAGFTSAYNSLLGGLTATVWDAVDIYQKVQYIMSIPAVVEADLQTKIAAFKSFAQTVISTIDPNGNSNSAVTVELFAAAAVTGAIMAVINTDPATRDQAVQTINDLNAMFTTITTGLDAVQTATAGRPATGQYFSNGLSYGDLARVVAMGIQYLLRLIFDLKVAKRFTLDRPRFTGEIVIAEYSPQDSGTYDDLYDLFIAANGLRSQEIFYLPAGREVVIYL